MSDTLDDDKPTRRDFLYITTGAFGVVGAASVAWPLIDQLIQMPLLKLFQRSKLIYHRLSQVAFLK